MSHETIAYGAMGSVTAFLPLPLLVQDLKEMRAAVYLACGRGGSRHGAIRPVARLGGRARPQALRLLLRGDPLRPDGLALTFGHVVLLSSPPSRVTLGHYNVWKQQEKRPHGAQAAGWRWKRGSLSCLRSLMLSAGQEKPTARSARHHYEGETQTGRSSSGLLEQQQCET